MKLIGFSRSEDSSLQVDLCISKLRGVWKRIVPVPDETSSIRGNEFGYAFPGIHDPPIEPRRTSGRVEVFHVSFDGYPRTFAIDKGVPLRLDGSQCFPRINESKEAEDDQPDSGKIFRRNQAREIAWQLTCGSIALWLGFWLVYHIDLHGSRGWHRFGLWLLNALGMILIGAGLGAFFLPVYWETDEEQRKHKPLFHGDKIVTQKLLTSYGLCNTIIPIGRSNPMANVLNTDKQIAVISALAEASSIRSIERINGVHRDTIMRLGAKIGRGCTALMDAKMRDLSCTRLEMGRQC
jgi:hypothetical protein